MACYDVSNNVLYADDDVVSGRYYGVPSVLVKTVTVDLGLSVPTNLCISFVCRVTGIIAYASGYARFTIVVNGETILTYDTKVCNYTTLSESYELVDGDVVDVYFGGYDSLGYPVSVSITRYDASARNFRISEVNVPPVSDAGGPYEGIIDEAVSFDGSGSTDQVGAIVLYEWDFGDGETDTGETVVHSYTDANTYTVVLTVTDDGGLTDADTTVAVVSEATVEGIPDVFMFGRIARKRRHRIEV